MSAYARNRTLKDYQKNYWRDEQTQNSIHPLSRGEISNKLLIAIREIGESIGEIKAQNLTHTALAKLELSARALFVSKWPNPF